MNKHRESIELIKAYKDISSRYDKVKTKPWKDFQEFYGKMQLRYSLADEGILYDIGGGNGRNLLLFSHDKWQAVLFDISLELLKLTVDLPPTFLTIITGTMTHLPFSSNTADLVLSIASLHHLSTSKQVLNGLFELKRIMKPGSYGIISVWRRWKKDTRKTMLKNLILWIFKKSIDRGWRHGDYFLPWKNEKGEIISQRYYHLYTKREIMKLTKKSGLIIEHITCMGGKYKRDNFFLLVKKE